VATERNIIFKTFKGKNQLQQDDEYYDEELAPTHFSNLYDPQEQELAGIQESIYTKFYPQIKDDINFVLK